MTTTYQAFDIGNSFQQSVDSIFSFLPKLLAFLIILIVGYLIAKVLKAVLTRSSTRPRSTKSCRKARPAAWSARPAPAGNPRT